MFDAILAFVMVIDVWFGYFYCMVREQQKFRLTYSETTILKVSRLCRIARLARVIHLLRFFPEIIVLLRSLKIAARAVLMTVSLLLFCVYILSVSIRLVTKDKEWQEKKWSSVPDTFLLLLIYGLFPDFSHLYKEITATSMALALVCFAFTVSLSLLFMNMLIGVLVEVVKGGCIAEKERADDAQLMNAIVPIAQQLNLDCNRLTFQNCMRIIDTKAMQICFKDVGLSSDGIDRFVNLIFPKHKLHCTLNEFIDILLFNRTGVPASMHDLLLLRAFMSDQVNLIGDSFRDAMREPSMGMSRQSVEN